MGEMGVTKGSGVGDGMPKEPERYTLEGHRGKIWKLAMHPTYSLVATASDDASIKIWEYENGEMEQTLRGHTGSITYVAFHPNGQVLASCSTDMTIKLWDLKKFQVYKTL
jgi:platelet-activating factor acetylhydrolase IB subunit alpha